MYLELSVVLIFFVIVIDPSHNADRHIVMLHPLLQSSFELHVFLQASDFRTLHFG